MRAPEPRIRDTYRAGDGGRIIAQHGELYAAEYGLDRSFEAAVASTVATAIGRGWPGPREAIRIVELGGEHAGSLALTDKGSGSAGLHWFALDPRLRGRGIGRRLVGELVAEARAAGYERIELVTFSELTSAAAIYRGAGFELLGSETEARWGRDAITMQRYELRFQRRAQSPSSPSTGRSSRPFSVNA